jgi:hypothetical protein
LSLLWHSTPLSRLFHPPSTDPRRPRDRSHPHLRHLPRLLGGAFSPSMTNSTSSPAR